MVLVMIRPQTLILSCSVNTTRVYRWLMHNALCLANIVVSLHIDKHLIAVQQDVLQIRDDSGKSEVRGAGRA